MSLTNAERAARHKENLKKQGYKACQVWLDKETQNMLDSLLVTNKELTKEKALQTLLKFSLGLVTGNNAVTGNAYKFVASNVAPYEYVTSNELKNHVFSKNGNNDVTSNDEYAVTGNDDSGNNDVTSNDEYAVTGNDELLIFDLDKSKAIAKDLKVKGMTANRIAKELARRGYGNRYGKMFSKSSINKWKC